MRLTLRTMLAYLDDILDDEQSRELGERIEESDFASGLVHRIRSVTRRLRLGVPTLQGRGMGLDPNTVSEYLENALPAERVPEIEKICLESDVHLAEVASCHQILILIESEPAEIDPDLKDRVYAIGAPNTTRRAARAPGRTGKPPVGGHAVVAHDPLEEPPVAGGAPAPPPAVAPLASSATTTLPSTRKSRDVPDYLRIGQNSRWKPLAITLVLAFVVSGVALRAMGPFDGSHPLLRLLGVSGNTEEVVQAPSLDSDVGISDDNSTSASADTSPGPAPGTTPDPDDIAETPVTPSTPVGPNELDAAASDPASAAEGPGSAVVPGPAEPGTNPQDMSAADAVPGPEPSVASESGGPVFPPTSSVVNGGPNVPGETDTTPPGAPVVDAGPPARPAAQPIVEVGYVKLTDRGIRNFLVRYDGQAGDWFRLPARSILSSGDQLVVFPTYRPEIVLTPGVQVAFASASAVRTSPPGPQGEPALAVDYGRLLIATAGVAGARIHLDFGRRGGTATFSDAASEMGIEVRQYLAPGSDPEVEPAILVVRMCTAIGAIEWQPDGVDASVSIPAGSARVIIADQAQTVALTEMPAWMQGETTDSLDRLAKEGLESAIAPDRPVELSLEEQSEGRKLEVRSLASRSLAHLDSYEALVRGFSDERQKSFWNKDFAILLDSIVRSPESAAAVRESLDRFCGDDATDLYRLLWGYSPEQLQAGSDQKLVDFLEHPSLSVRIFALENLRRITDKTLSFRPEVIADRRKGSVQEWRVRLENGAIVYDVPPSAATMDGR